MAMAEPRGEGILDLPQALSILLFLPPQAAGPLEAAGKNSALARAAASEALWSAHAGTRLGLSGTAVGPRGEECGGSWRKAVRLYQKALPTAEVHEALAKGGVEGPLRARWLTVWQRLRQWLEPEAPSVLATLKAPATEALLEEFRGLEGLCAEPAVLGCWCVHNGQDAPMEPGWARRCGMRTMRRGEEWARGLLGGYCVYQHQVSTLLLPLNAALSLTRFCRQKGLLEGMPTRMAFAASFNMEKIFFVDTKTGEVFVWTGHPSGPFELCLPAPASLQLGGTATLRGLGPELDGTEAVLSGYNKVTGMWQVSTKEGERQLRQENLQGAPQPGAEGLLNFFEEYASRLENKIFGVMPLRPEGPPPMHGICLFPIGGSSVSVCVTRGVEVTASCAYTPENAQAGWAYSIALRLVGTEEERGFKSCQLHTRHWIIREEGQREASHVNGEAVIGFKPILVDGGWLLNEESDPNRQYDFDDGFQEGAFRYQSCSGRNNSMRGSFGGEITFVPGTVRRPTGPPFEAKLMDFQLLVPGFIF